MSLEANLNAMPRDPDAGKKEKLKDTVKPPLPKEKEAPIVKRTEEDLALLRSINVSTEEVDPSHYDKVAASVGPTDLDGAGLDSEAERQTEAANAQEAVDASREKSPEQQAADAQAEAEAEEWRMARAEREIREEKEALPSTEEVVAAQAASEPKEKKGFFARLRGRRMSRKEEKAAREAYAADDPELTPADKGGDNTDYLDQYYTDGSKIHTGPRTAVEKGMMADVGDNEYVSNVSEKEKKDNGVPGLDSSLSEHLAYQVRRGKMKMDRSGEFEVDGMDGPVEVNEQYEGDYAYTDRLKDDMRARRERRKGNVIAVAEYEPKTDLGAGLSDITAPKATPKPEPTVVAEAESTPVEEKPKETEKPTENVAPVVAENTAPTPVEKPREDQPVSPQQEEVESGFVGGKNALDEFGGIVQTDDPLEGI